MVINPKQLLESITKKDQTMLKRLEKRIDECLSEDFDGSSTCISINDDCASLRPYVLNQLLNKYRHAGWSVKTEYDSREGDAYLLFSYKKRKGSEKK